MYFEGELPPINPGEEISPEEFQKRFAQEQQLGSAQQRTGGKQIADLPNPNPAVNNAAQGAALLNSAPSWGQRIKNVTGLIRRNPIEAALAGFIVLAAGSAARKAKPRPDPELDPSQAVSIDPRFNLLTKNQLPSMPVDYTGMARPASLGYKPEAVSMGQGEGVQFQELQLDADQRNRQIDYMRRRLSTDLITLQALKAQQNMEE